MRMSKFTRHAAERFLPFLVFVFIASILTLISDKIIENQSNIIVGGISVRVRVSTCFQKLCARAISSNQNITSSVSAHTKILAQKLVLLFG